jgi:hypothetical protein
MTTQNTVSHEPHTAATVDAEKVRRVLSVREPSKNQDKSAAQATEPKPASR